MLTDDELVAAAHKFLSSVAYNNLTIKRWKDGIDIDYPTVLLRNFAEHFLRLGAERMRERAASKADDYIDCEQVADAIRALKVE